MRVYGWGGHVVCLWPCWDPVGRLRPSLAVRSLCQACTRGCRGTVPSGSHHCAWSGPSISMHLHPYPQGPSAFQGASVLLSAAFFSFPLLCSTPAGSRGFPHWNCLGQNQHCSGRQRSEACRVRALPLWPTQSPDPSSSGSHQQPGHTWPLLESRTHRQGTVCNAECRLPRHLSRAFWTGTHLNRIQLFGSNQSLASAHV